MISGQVKIGTVHYDRVDETWAMSCLIFRQGVVYKSCARYVAN